MTVDLDYDVIIIGGGPAGTVAAIAAAREGASVLLVEQGGCLGGALTRSGTGPMMTFHAGGTQVVRGIPEEIVQRLGAGGFSPGHMEDFVGYTSSVTPFDAEGLKLVLETMAQEAGVRLLYHTMYTGSTRDGGLIRSVRLFSKNGCFTARAKVFIDCSGDADLAFHTGVPTQYGRPGDHLAQPMTLNIKVANVDRIKVINYVRDHPDDMLETTPFARLADIPRTGIQGAFSLVATAKSIGDLHLDRDRVLAFETNNEGEFILNMSRITKRSAVDPFDLTAAEIEGRRQAHEIVAFMRKYIPGFENCVVVSTGPDIGIRESRRIQGSYLLTADDLLENRMFPDAIVMGSYPIDVHSPDGEETNHRFLRPGSWYSIPYRILTCSLDNLLVAGRCVSASHEASAAIRVTPIVMAMGQAAGTAAAQAAASDGNVRHVDVSALRATLRDKDVFLEEWK